MIIIHIYHFLFIVNVLIAKMGVCWGLKGQKPDLPIHPQCNQNSILLLV